MTTPPPPPPPPPIPAYAPPPSGSPADPSAWSSGQSFVPVAPQSAPRGLRIASLILMGCTAAMTGIAALAEFYRKSVWDDFTAGGTQIRDLASVDDADALVAGAAGFTMLLTLATAIVTSLWARRAGQSVVAHGAQNVSPGLACGSWYIPVAWYIVPFIQLRRMARIRGNSRTAIGWWQGLFIAGSLIGNFGMQAAETNNTDVDDVSSVLLTNAVAASIGTALLAGAVFFATTGMRKADGGQ